MSPIRGIYEENAEPGSEFRGIADVHRPSGSLLLIGNDGGLQHSRQLLLERAKFKVYCLNSRQALAGESPADCQLALICRSVNHTNAQWIARTLHATQPGLPILRFATTGEAPSVDFATLRRESATPPVLLAEVSRLLLP